ncbi:MAG: hypothetical protein EA405_10900 [Rhodospirillales bacterium]|nr:MAG: hypothetical protein EA405_10900 [Rhodospirillales bacterium]
MRQDGPSGREPASDLGIEQTDEVRGNGSGPDHAGASGLGPSLRANNNANGACLTDTPKHVTSRRSRLVMFIAGVSAGRDLL